MISPFKASVGGEYRKTEARLQRAIHLRFGLPADLPPEAVKRIKAFDRVSAYMEAVALAGFEEREARRLFGAPLVAVEAFAAHLEPSRPAEVGVRFLARFAELDAAVSGA